jgi:hypothetical protein
MITRLADQLRGNGMVGKPGLGPAGQANKRLAAAAFHVVQLHAVHGGVLIFEAEKLLDELLVGVNIERHRIAKVLFLAGQQLLHAGPGQVRVALVIERDVLHAEHAEHVLHLLPVGV